MSTAIRLTAAEVAAYYAARAPKVKQTTAREWRGPCPVHDGQRDSFAVNAETGRAHCHSACAKGWDIIGLERELSDVGFAEAKRAVFELIGRAEEPRPARRREIAWYKYTGADGQTLFRVIRTEPKGFFQQRPDGNGGWVNGVAGVQLVLFRLPKIAAAKSVFVVEGEKDVLALEGLGFAATCNVSGAGNWRDAYAAFLTGKRVAILPDNDAPGREHALQVAASVLKAGAESVRIVELPGLPDKGDVSDWIAAGGTSEQLLELTKGAAELTPEALTKLRARWFPEKADKAGGIIGIATRCIADIEARPISWLWPGRIARGKLTILAGNPGLGKSQVTASIAAIVTTGGLWPVDRQPCPIGKVLFVNCEDDPGDTLRPRLEAAGARLELVHTLDGVNVGQRGDGTPGLRPFNLAEDIERLREKLEDLGDVMAVFIDPITAFLGGDTDSHKNSDVRALLAPLSDLAAHCGAAVIGVSHLSKAGGSQALMRVSGSLAFVAAARAAFLVAQDPEEPSRRLFLPMKNNLGPDSSGLAFRIEGVSLPSAAGLIGTSRVVWEAGKVEQSADEVLNAGNVQREARSALADAVDWLRDLLEQHGPLPAKSMEFKAKQAGLAMATVRRAAESLKVEKTKTGMDGGWEWSLPKMLKFPEGAQEKNASIFGSVEHLRATEGTPPMVEVVI